MSKEYQIKGIEKILEKVSEEDLAKYYGVDIDSNNVEYYGGYGPKSAYEETDKIKEEKARNEKLILQLTEKDSIDELSLKDFINLKKKLENEQKELQKKFEEKFTKRENNERE